MPILEILGAVAIVLACISFVGWLAACAGAGRWLSLREWL